MSTKLSCPEITARFTKFILLILQIFHISLISLHVVYNLACGGTLNSFSGKIASPNYPNSYPLNIECVWTIQVAAGNKVTLNIEKLDIPSTENCVDDYLEVREQEASGKLLGVYCGTDPQRNITSTGSIWMKFRSSNEGAATGFLAEFNYGK